MQTESMASKVCMEMISFNSKDPKRIQHLLKVHSFSMLIGEAEGMDQKQLEILEIAAYVHDIGIKPAQEKYGSCSGKLQEQEGPPEAEKLLKRLGAPEELIERVCFLVGHHHTYSQIDGLDYQILVEADFLVNLFEDEISADGRMSAYQKIFRTETGRKIFREMFGSTKEGRNID